MDADERETIRLLLQEWEESKVEVEEGESKMALAETELEDLGITDPATYQLPEE